MLFNYHIHYMNFLQQKFIIWIKSSYNAYIHYMNHNSYNEYDQVFIIWIFGSSYNALYSLYEVHITNIYCINVPAAMQWCHFQWSNCKKSSFGSDESQAGFQLWGRRSRWVENSEKEKLHKIISNYSHTLKNNII
jgi:hypothetical protein